MAITATAGLVIEAWHDFDRATATLSCEDAERRLGTASSISWTLAHSTHMVDRWLNQLFQQRAAHALIDQDAYRIGALGQGPAWDAVRTAVGEVRGAARPYVEGLTEQDLDQRCDYHGSLDALRATGITPRYALLRIAAHHYLHLGEIVALRHQMGHHVGDYPGVLEACLP